MAMSSMLTKSFSHAFGLFIERIGAGEINCECVIRELNDSSDVDQVIAKQLDLFQKAIPTMSKRQKQQLLILLVYLCQFQHFLKDKTCLSAMAPFVVTFVEQTNKAVEKKVGYLAMGSLLECTDKIVYLCVNTIIKDISGKDPSVIVMALNVIPHIHDVDLLQSITPFIERRLSHSDCNVRKSSFMALHSMFRIHPELIKNCELHFRTAITDHNPEVTSSTIPYMHDLLKAFPQNQEKVCSKLVVILEQIVSGCLPVFMSKKGIPAPWTQINLLKIFEDSQFGDETKWQLGEILVQMLNRYQISRERINFAVQSQCLSLIFSKFHPNDRCFEPALNCLKVLLQVQETKRNSNVLAIGLEHLTKLSEKRPAYCYTFQTLVMNCLSHEDLTIQKQTFLLLHSLINEKNFKTVFDHLMKNLQDKFQHSQFGAKMSERSCHIIKQFSNNTNDLLANLHILLAACGDCSCEKATKLVFETISTAANEDDIRREFDRCVELILSSESLSFNHYCVIIWVIGEYSDHRQHDLNMILNQLRNHCIDLKERKHKESVLLYICVLYKIALKYEIQLDIDELTADFISHNSVEPTTFQILGQLRSVVANDKLRNEIKKFTTLLDAEDVDDYSFLDKFAPQKQQEEEEMMGDLIDQLKISQQTSPQRFVIRNRNDYIAAAAALSTSQLDKSSPFLDLSEDSSNNLVSGGEMSQSTVWGLDGYRGDDAPLLTSSVSVEQEQVCEEQQIDLLVDEPTTALTNAIFNLSSVPSDDDETPVLSGYPFMDELMVVVDDINK